MLIIQKTIITQILQMEQKIIQNQQIQKQKIQIIQETIQVQHNKQIQNKQTQKQQILQTKQKTH